MTDNAQRLEALSGLEGDIADLLRMAHLLEIAAEETILCAHAEIVGMIKKESPLARSWNVFLLTDAQENAIDYAIRHTVDLVQALHKAYYAALEGRASA